MVWHHPEGHRIGMHDARLHWPAATERGMLPTEQPRAIIGMEVVDHPLECGTKRVNLVQLNITGCIDEIDISIR